MFKGPKLESIEDEKESAVDHSDITIKLRSVSGRVKVSSKHKSKKATSKGRDASITPYKRSEKSLVLEQTIRQTEHGFGKKYRDEDQSYQGIPLIGKSFLNSNSNEKRI